MKEVTEWQKSTEKLRQQKKESSKQFQACPSFLGRRGEIGCHHNVK
jgi:hypothetical protein